LQGLDVVGLLRDIQKRTHGFTEFVPLRFIHQNTLLFRKGLVAPPPPKGHDDFRMYAFSRLFLRGLINNIQTSWVKMGVDMAALTLKAGCNDFSGTLMEESITRRRRCRRIRSWLTDRGVKPPRWDRSRRARYVYRNPDGKRAPNGAGRSLPPASITTLAGEWCSQVPARIGTAGRAMALNIIQHR
jgi:2-iminoacetate synthase ThiH